MLTIKLKNGQEKEIKNYEYISLVGIFSINKDGVIENYQEDGEIRVANMDTVLKEPYLIKDIDYIEVSEGNISELLMPFKDCSSNNR